jgi:hypothetical protein
MDEQQARLAELVEYTRYDMAERDWAQPNVNKIEIHHHHYPPAVAPVPVPEMDIASRYAGHFVLAVWAMIALAGVAVVFVMIAQALMIAMISLAICCLAFAAMVRSLRQSGTDHKIMKQRLKATE